MLKLKKSATYDGIRNAKANNIKDAKFANDDSTNFINKYEGNIDVLVMDPPHKGLAVEFKI